MTDPTGDPRPHVQGFIQSWYPLCLTREVPRSGVKPVEAFDGGWVVFRTQTGALAVMSRYCPHMGTDLANGRVTDDTLECPMHRWRFAASGIAQDAAGQACASATARRLPVTERFGVIFVFWGDQSLFPLPETQELHEPVCGPARKVADQVPYEAISLNLFDAQHFYHVHNRRVLGSPAISSDDPNQLNISFRANVMPVSWFDRLLRTLGYHQTRVEAELWGGNLMLVHNRQGNYVAFLALRPLSPDACELYISIQQNPARSFPARMFQRLRLHFITWAVLKFGRTDVPIIRGMRPFPGELTVADEAARRFWDYFLSLPRRTTVPAASDSAENG